MLKGPAYNYQRFVSAGCPNPNEKHPMEGFERVKFLKNVITPVIPAKAGIQEALGLDTPWPHLRTVDAGLRK